eukprot:Awhi_evm1s2146
MKGKGRKASQSLMTSKKNTGDYDKLVMEAIIKLGNRNGSQKDAILNYVRQKYNSPENEKKFISGAIQRLVAKKKIVGIGGQRFKLAFSSKSSNNETFTSKHQTIKSSSNENLTSGSKTGNKINNINMISRKNNNTGLNKMDENGKSHTNNNGQIKRGNNNKIRKDNHNDENNRLRAQGKHAKFFLNPTQSKSNSKAQILQHSSLVTTNNVNNASCLLKNKVIGKKTSKCLTKLKTKKGGKKCHQLIQQKHQQTGFHEEMLRQQQHQANLKQQQQAKEKKQNQLIRKKKKKEVKENQLPLLSVNNRQVTRKTIAKTGAKKKIKKKCWKKK